MGLKKLLGKAAGKQAQREVPEAAIAKSEEPPQSSTSAITKGTKERSKKDIKTLPLELFEATLMFLPMKDILLSQRVARRWREVIQGSTMLQQSLFMTLREADDIWEVCIDETDPDRIRKLVRLQKNKVKSEDTKDNVRIVQGAELNPMWFTDKDTNVKPLDILKGKRKVNFCFKAELEEPLKSKKWMNHPEASWRKMLIIQPPVRSYYYFWATSGTVQRKLYITVGDVVDKWVRKADKRDMDTIDFLVHHMSLTTFDLICLSERVRAEAIDLTCTSGGKA